MTDAPDLVFPQPIDVVVVPGFRRDGTCEPFTRSFAGIADMRAEFGLTNVVTLAQDVLAASATGTPHVAVCPYALEIDDERELLVQDSMDGLREIYETSCDAI